MQFKRISSGTPIFAFIQYGKPIAATNHRTGFQRKMLENYYLWICMGFLLSVLCSRHPIELDMTHLLAYATETGLRASSLLIIK